MSPSILFPRHNDYITIGGYRWQAQSASKPYSLEITDDTYRFETHRGECAPFDKSGSRERSEVYCTTRVPFNTVTTVELDFLIEPGPPSNRVWNIPLQCHADDAVLAGPVVCLNISLGADRTTEMIGLSADTTAARYRQFPASIVPFTRGVFHHVKLTYVDAQGVSAGSIKFEYDGVTLVDLTNIPTGYADAIKGSYWKFGQYMGPDLAGLDPHMVSIYRNIAVTIAS